MRWLIAMILILLLAISTAVEAVLAATDSSDYDSIYEVDIGEGRGVEAVDIFGSCDHFQYKQDHSDQKGMHVLCLVQTNAYTINVNIILNGRTEKAFSYPYDPARLDATLIFEYIKKFIHPTERAVEGWLATDSSGTAIFSIDRMIYEGTIFVFTGGNYMIPGVRIGYEQTNSFGHRITTLSLRPLVFRVSNFLTHDECDHIKLRAEPHLKQSLTSKMDHDLDKPDSTWRTSEQYFLPSQEDDIISSIDSRVADLTKTQVNQQEQVQVLRYLEGQFYKQHTDYFDPSLYKGQPDVLDSIEHGESNRYITVLWYLSNVSSGGYTLFPKSFNVTHRREDEDCFDDDSVALKVPPSKGDVIVFYSLFADRSLDETSLHAACPVGAGETKWAANKWIWSKQKYYLN